MSQIVSIKNEMSVVNDSMTTLCTALAFPMRRRRWGERYDLTASHEEKPGEVFRFVFSMFRETVEAPNVHKIFTFLKGLAPGERDINIVRSSTVSSETRGKHELWLLQLVRLRPVLSD